MENLVSHTQQVNKRIKHESDCMNKRRKFHQVDDIKPELTRLSSEITKQVGKNR